MWVNNRIIQEDLDYICSCDFISWDKLKDKTIFITGTTGIIGQNIVNSLLYASNKFNLNIKVIGLVRDFDKAKELFSAQLRDTKGLEFVMGDVRSFKHPNCSIDYIIHGASITSSKLMVEKPDEVISINVDGTRNIINLAREKKVKTLLYLSSMEVYGQSEKGKIIKEDDTWDFDESNPRNSYPLSKQKCEELCLEYAKENTSLVKINRLAQTIGPGLSENDEKIFSYFARCLINKEDIVLKTKGESERCYNYTIDTVAGILTTLLDESKENIYNVANNNTYSSIKDVANNIAKDKVNVVFDTTNNNQYPNDSYLLLDESKLESLGFKHKHNDFFDRYMEYLRIKNNPLISIVVPVYNVEKYLDRCVKSLLKQTYKNIEILLIDDGSTDSCGELCDQYASSNNNITTYHKTNGGLSDARNFGIKEAKGDYISFVDSDDLVSNDYIEYLLYLVNKYSTCISSALYTRVKDYEKEFNKTTYNEWCFTKGESLSEVCYGDRLRAISCCKLYRRDIFDKCSFPKGRYYEDQCIMYEIIDSVLSVSSSSKIIYSYTMNTNSITQSNVKKQCVDFGFAMDQLINYTSNKSDDIKKAVACRCIIFLYQILSVYFNSDIDKTIFNHFRNIYRNQLLLVASSSDLKFNMRLKARVILLGYYPSKIVIKHYLNNKKKLYYN